MAIKAPIIAQKAYTGNFIFLRINDTGKRFPLTIADYNKENGTINIVFQVVGKITKLLSHQNVGDKSLDVVGPLGNTNRLKKGVIKRIKLIYFSRHSWPHRPQRYFFP